ncbi:Protein MS5 [Arabidopsis thaliana x Arabidopsis arenosa]|uniref:Protein MS5 n=1 Tax=Arabidopsis thaliana x Arabidopsis arenosa TaxID=1240361 RepID=A0A8T2GK94_9BRAS|nr:Protein MS5 [Arabidopsis thaliana x Arabidopsis arenosa]
MPTEDRVCFTWEEYARHVREYWRGVAEFDGFDSEDIRSPVVLTGLFHYDCQSGRHYPEPLLGTSFELAALLKFNKTMNLTSSYYITLLAHDPSLQKTFQVRVDEREYGSLDLTVAIARPKKDQNEVSDGVFQGPLPDWPSEDALRHDRNRFYELEISEWQATDWISLYLKLLILATDRGMFVQTGLPQVQILEVVIETEEENEKPPDKRLNARRAHVYITFTGLPKSPRLVEIGEHVERKAIIRRVIDASGYLTLLGKFWSGKDTDQQRSMTLASGEQAESSKKRPRLS